MKFELDPLPYAKNALAPHLTEETLSFHYDKHHQAYMTNLKNLLEGKPEAEKSLEEIVKTSSGGVFNNAAQVWNHTFYWNSMKPSGGGEPTGALAEAIKRDFGSYADFKKQFAEASVKQFGSGWGWLVKEGDKLKIVTTGNAETPITKGQTPLITCDVWEHAYYIDYRNLRAKYVDTFLEKLVNWEWAAAQFK
ncbi:MAG: superoxide dismutase [Fe] [Archangium gephyra]|uniref:Superoxide dismutase n=1 Tax=Archangium gephyra TaxID=48 RepID=A0A2W5T9W4_9BACT|nr:MAG: superoxide dismutase [Fe] [Archangium gephyra]